MLTATVQPPYSKLPIELLQLYATGLPDAYLVEIKDLVARFLIAKARK